MTKLRVSPSLSLPTDAVTQTFAIFGKRGSGKSNTAVVLAEEMLKVGAPIVVLDPVSAWWGLKASFDGKGPGRDVYVFGGPHGDLPLQPTAGELMAQVFIRHRIPMVLDMKGWAGAERARFVTAFAEWLLGHNDRVPMHVFMEEADAFVPQRPYKGEERMLGAMDRLVRWGRQDGIGATLITQRSAKVNKDVTTQAETLIAHRTTGPQDRDAIDSWIRYHAGDEQRQAVLATLPTLPDGTAWVWSPEWLNILEQVPFRRRETFDSASTPKLGEKRPQPKELAQVDVDRLRDQLATTIEEAKANDPAELRKQVASMRQAVRNWEHIANDAREAAAAAKPERVVETVTERVEVPILTEELARTFLEVATAVADAAATITAAVSAAVELSRARSTIVARLDAPSATLAPHASVPRGTPPPERPPIEPKPAADEPDAAVQLDAGARRMLECLASLHPSPLTRQQLGTLANVPHTGSTFRTYLSQLRRAALIEEPDKAIVRLSPDGIGRMSASLGSGAPSVAELVAMWGRKVDAGARRMLDILVDLHPAGISREALGEQTGIPHSGSTFRTYLSQLRRNQLLEEAGGEVHAGPALFIGEAR